MFRLYIRFKLKDKLYFFDIDNTLANTWPTLVGKKHSSEKSRLANLQIFANMRNLILNLSKDSLVIYLTHRTPSQYIVTKNWLLENGLPVSFGSLLIVASPVEKVKIVEGVCQKAKVKVVDDLSFGQEDGNLNFYNEVIELLQNLPIKYYNYRVIQRINNWRV